MPFDIYPRIGTGRNEVLKEQCSTINFKPIAIMNKCMYALSFIRIIICDMCYINTMHTTMAPFTLRNDYSHEAVLVRFDWHLHWPVWRFGDVLRQLCGWVLSDIAILFVYTRLNHYSGVIKYKNERDLNAVGTINSSISFIYGIHTYIHIIHAFKRIEFINRHDCESHTHKRAITY